MSDASPYATGAERLVEETRVAREVWEGYDDEQRRRELSHWRGVGKYADDKRWLSIGRKSSATLSRMARLAKRPWRDGEARPCMLEWGPGGGANAFALAPHASTYFGVDISAPNLAEAQRMTLAEGIPNFRPVLLSDDLAAVTAAVDQPVNIFLSTAVFQHFPSREYGVAVLRTIRSVCAEGAIGFIQIRYEDGKFRGARNVGEYKSRFVTATSYGIGEFADACDLCGFDVLCLLDINTKVNYVTFCLTSRA